MTSCDDGASDIAAGLLVLTTGNPSEAAYARLCTALDGRGFQRGQLVGPVLAVSGPREQLETLARYVDASGGTVRPPDADVEFLDALEPVDHFAWDQGAETF